MEKRYWWFVGGLAIVFILAIGGLQFWKWQQFGYNGLDLGIYSQTLWSLSQGQGFANSIHDPSYLGDHLEAWLIPLAAFYRLWPTPVTLLWAQTIVLALAAIPVAALARHLLNWKAGLVVTGLFLAHPFLYNAALYEFHGLIFALPLLLGGILAYVQQRYWWWLVAMVGVLLVREDMPIVVAGFAILAAVERRSFRWWAPPLVLAAAWFFTAQLIISSAQQLGQYKYLAFYGWMGTNVVEIVLSPFRHPVIFLQHIFQPNNWLTASGFLIGFGLLPIVRPKYLIPVGVLFFQLILIGAPSDSLLRLHYVIPYLPFLAWATLVLVHDVLQGKALVRFDKDFVRPIVIALAIIGPLYTFIIFGAAERPWGTRADVGLTDPTILHAALDHVPSDAAVLTSFNYLPYLANRSELYSLNYLHLGRRQYSEAPYTIPGQVDVALIDWQQYYHFAFLYRDTEFQDQTGPQRLVETLEANHLKLAYWQDSVTIYTRDGELQDQLTRRVGQSTATDRVGPTAIGQPIIQQLARPRLTGVDWREYQIDQTWKQNQMPEIPFALRITLTDSANNSWTSTRLLGQGAVPSNQWLLGEEWQTSYRIVVPDTISPDAQLTLEVLKLDGRWRLDRIRQFTLKTSQLEVVETVASSLAK